MNRLTHWIAHKFGLNTGQVVTRWDSDRLMIGFRCDVCGDISGEHESVTSQSLVIRAIGCSDDSERSRQITNDVYLSDEKHEWPDPPTAFCPEQAPRSDPPEIDLR